MSEFAKKATVWLTCILLLSFMASCFSTERPQAEVSPAAKTKRGDEVYKVTVDGIDCIVYDGYRRGGISCDWTKESGVRN